MKFNFEFGQTIKTQIDIFDRVLVYLNRPLFLENPDFVFDQASAGTFQLIAYINKDDRNIAPIEIYLQGDGLRIDIDQIPETFELTIDRIESNALTTFNFLLDLFCSFIYVKRSNREIMVDFLKENGELSESVKVRNLGLFGKADPKSITGHLYFPIYNVSNRNLSTNVR